MMTDQQYQKCIEACLECAAECNSCAVSCLKEKIVQPLTKCIRLNLEGSIICRASAEIMSLGSGYSKQICQICVAICNACAEECEKHAAMGMEHCKECADACRACAKEIMEIANDSKEENQFVYQEECAVLSRLASELMSLESPYCKQICDLNAIVCNASANELEKDANMEMQQSKECALIAQEVQKHLVNQQMEENKNAAVEKPTPKTEAVTKKKKHYSVLLGAASLWRSPVNHARAHVDRSVRGTSNIANTGTIITYKPAD